jgi:transketolase
VRTAFAETLLEMARDDDRIVLMVGDLGFGVVTRFMEELPEQFINAGVAEQNMTGMAAGLALSGKVVFTYSIANFPVLRCLEQIRNDVCYHNAAVCIVPVGGGMAYGALGPSHHATEDLAVVRALPNLTVVAPGDPAETRLATRALADHGGPAYLRLGRAGEPLIHSKDPAFELGKAITVREGADVCLIATGGMLHNTVQAAATLSSRGIEARVLSMHTIKPIDAAAVVKSARCEAIFTIEEHSIIGGLGSAVAEVLMEADVRPRHFRRIGLDGSFSTTVGDQAYLLKHYGLDDRSIASTVESELRNSGTRRSVAKEDRGR